MKRILQVATIASALRSFLLPFAEHFRAQGWQVDGMAQGVSACDNCVKAFDQVWDVTWSRNPLDPRNLIVAPQTIQKIVEQQKYDIVHVHTPVAAFVTRYALQRFRKSKNCKIIYTAHGFHFYRGGSPLKNAAFLTLEKLAGYWTDYLVVMNQEDRDAIDHYQLLPSDRVRYMPGIGVDLEYYSPRAVSKAEVSQIRQALGIEQHHPLFLSVAEFIPRKRPQDILKAFARLDRANAHLVFADTGPLLEEMQRLASVLGVEDRVHFLGYRSDIPALMRASTAMLLASAQEGLPRSVMEALALELPVIGTAIRGTQDLLGGGCGRLVKVGDVEGLAQAMAWVLDHPQDAQLMVQRGRERMALYGLQSVLKQYETLYAEALEPVSSDQITLSV